MPAAPRSACECADPSGGRGAAALCVRCLAGATAGAVAAGSGRAAAGAAAARGGCSVTGRAGAGVSADAGGIGDGLLGGDETADF